MVLQRYAPSMFFKLKAGGHCRSSYSATHRVRVLQASLSDCFIHFCNDARKAKMDAVCVQDLLGNMPQPVDTAVAVL